IAANSSAQRLSRHAKRNSTEDAKHAKQPKPHLAAPNGAAEPAEPAELPPSLVAGNRTNQTLQKTFQPKPAPISKS
ncbi:unnamed protein product, partial [Symbiodinium natans]